MISGLIGWIILGGIVGLIAKWSVPGKEPAGAVFTIMLGMAGAVLGGILFGRGLLAGHSLDHQAVGGWIGAILGSPLLLWLYRRYSVGKTAEV
jgi:uncharacterized membrane protein YeaQ/YmgE (transglycosylase-associated protein family)